MTLAVLQARTTSTRLPGKVMMPILGRAMLLRQIDRVLKCQKFNKLIIATSHDASDTQLARMCEDSGISVYRGSLDDVLDRFYQAAKPYSPKHVVRLTGDCPLADSKVIDHVIDVAIKSDSDYTSNTLQPTYPDGLDVEVAKFSALTKAWELAKKKSQREHVMPYLYNASSGFKILNVVNDTDLSKMRWTVDEPNDFKFVTQIYERLFPENPNFSMQDVLDLLKREPQLATVNEKIIRNEGYIKSLKTDQENV